MANASPSDEVVIHLALPKGHMQAGVYALLEEAGVKVSLSNSRGYRPSVPLPNYDCKLLKPQNILGMLAAGTRDIGFAGGDWVEELGIEGLVEVLDTGLDPVRIVAAAPDPKILEKGVGAEGRKLIVASEYSGLTKKWLERKGIVATVLKSYGATESLPPEDADLIVDNAATGSTLKANSLEILDTLMHSTTRMYASTKAWADPAKRARIESLVLLLTAVLNARKRLMVTFNISKASLDTLVSSLPSCVASWDWAGGRATVVLIRPLASPHSSLPLPADFAPPPCRHSTMAMGSPFRSLRSASKCPLSSPRLRQQVVRTSWLAPSRCLLHSQICAVGKYLGIYIDDDALPPHSSARRKIAEISGRGGDKVAAHARTFSRASERLSTVASRCLGRPPGVDSSSGGVVKLTRRDA